jgi:hypothetical protein
MNAKHVVHSNLERLSALSADDPRLQSILSHFGVQTVAPILTHYDRGDDEDRMEIDTAVAFYLSQSGAR